MIRRTWLAALALGAGIGTTAAAGPPARTPATQGEERAPTRLEVDLSERTLYLHHDGEIVNRYPVAVGEPEHPTPRGSFEIDRVEWNPDWTPPDTEWGREKEAKDPDDPENPMVGAKLFFEYPDYYIHGTDAVHTLGEAESHGCIRMDPDEVLDLAEWVQRHAGEERGDAWFRAAGRDDGTEEVVSLPDPVPVEIHG